MLKEIKSCEFRGNDARYVSGDQDRLSRLLFQAASVGVKIPSLDAIMSCDPERIKAETPECGNFCFQLYTLGSNSQSGFVQAQCGDGSVITATWENGRLIESRVTNPLFTILKGISRKDICKMRLFVDGKYYSGRELEQLLEELLPERDSESIIMA